jgi:lipopolysaccharide transport system ATP-binding protein
VFGLNGQPLKQNSNFEFRNSNSDHFWALKDVSFEVKKGEVLGVIGRNGAGKSTLLKILSRITEPTSGGADIHGRVGSLLEVGTGFHSDLTGRENVYFSGAILGMKKVEIDRKFDEMVAFAEVEKFIDTPIKHYSSGMSVRLAFAVAANLEPEILLVDEVLAVGDASFQKKCLGKIDEVSKGGRTVLFVSHNMAVVQNLCKRVIVLVRGHSNFDGMPEQAIQWYMEETMPTPVRGEIDLSSHPARDPGCLPLLKAVRLTDSNGTAKNRFRSGEMVTIELEFDALVPLKDPLFGIGVNDWMGARIFSLATYLSNSKLPPLIKPCKVTCKLDEIPLEPGRYSLSLSAGTHHNALIDSLPHAMTFEVEAGDFFGNGRVLSGQGKVLVRSLWDVKPENG